METLTHSGAAAIDQTIPIVLIIACSIVVVVFLTALFVWVGR